MSDERLAEIRETVGYMEKRIGAGWQPSDAAVRLSHSMAAELLAALDAEKARSAKAGRDLVLAGEQARERERALNAQMTEAVMAAEARAQTAEDALAAELSARHLSGEVLQRCDAVLNGPSPDTHWRSLHDVDVQVAALKARAKTAEDALARLREVAHRRRVAHPHGDTAEIDAALDAIPADLAEASRREWKAQGMEEAARLLDDGHVGRDDDPHSVCSDALRDIREAATKLRGER